ncbi:MAG: histidine--tRNA ligase [Candidatus Obscuribacterales bacterium]|nr:histidine--tRNA ligase [Candidatus Obscuribacterales bacterium]
MSKDNAISVAPPRGMRDFLPSQVALRDWATAAILSTYKRFGFTRIETPVLENIASLRGGDGGENLQLIYEVLKRGEKLEKALSEGAAKDELADLGLRFDLTVPLVRYYSHNQSQLPNPLKSIQVGSVFRAESPQKGRFRQFTQCDIDIIGVKSELAEMELIQATSEALIALGFSNFKILINDRRLLSALALHCGFVQEKAALVFIALDKLEKIGLDGVSKELAGEALDPQATAKLIQVLTVLAAAKKSGQTSYVDLKAALPVLDEQAMSGLEKIISTVSEISKGRFSIEFDPTLVRGMGYYTGPIFEVKVPGYTSSVGGGGRYDNMVGKFSGRDVPACGFSIGFERVIDILTEKEFKPQTEERSIVLIVDPERDSGLAVLNAAQELRSGGNIVCIQPRKKDMKKQLDTLLAQGYSHFCVFRGQGSELEVKSLGG